MKLLGPKDHQSRRPRTVGCRIEFHTMWCSLPSMHGSLQAQSRPHSEDWLLWRAWTSTITGSPVSITSAKTNRLAHPRSETSTVVQWGSFQITFCGWYRGGGLRACETWLTLRVRKGLPMVQKRRVTSPFAHDPPLRLIITQWIL